MAPDNGLGHGKFGDGIFMLRCIEEQVGGLLDITVPVRVPELGPVSL